MYDRGYYQRNREKILAKRHAKPRTERQRAQGRLYRRRYYEKNREKILAHFKTPEYRAANREYQKKDREKNPERARLRQKLWKQKRLEIKAGRPKPDRCEVCNRNHRRIHFDHCHRSGEFRGWICSDCNMMLGLAEDSVERLQKLIGYLTKRA